MGENSKSASPSNPSQTLVLVGRVGNGKSAVGNSILGREAFLSRASWVSATRRCQLERVIQDDDKIINVIDTPGLFCVSTAPDVIAEEILRCKTIAEDGIHAILLVFSVRDRLIKERDVFSHLQTLFGSKIANYMIIVFTGGDELEDKLEDHLARQGCPEIMKEMLELCDNRLILFDNKTKDEIKKVEQVEKLLALVDQVAKQNNGKPFTYELSKEEKKKIELEIELLLRKRSEFNTKMDEFLAKCRS